MGICGSSESGEDTRNAKINKIQADLKKQENMEVKLLLVGAGDSGKTTLRKQMRLLYGEGFNDDQKKEMREVICSNILDGAKLILLNGIASKVTDADLDDQNVEIGLIKEIFGEEGEFIFQQDMQLGSIEDDLANALKTLWLENDAYKASYKQKSKFHLQDCWTGFMESLVNEYPKWGGADWLPTDDECVKARIRTSGVSEENFTIDGITFKLFDAGGQRAERRKWIHFFDGVTAVMFVASLSDYDQNLFEDHEKSRLEESIEVFSDVCNSKWFIEVPMLLFLNKRDLFEKKYTDMKIPINKTGMFPTAPKIEDTNSQDAIEWFTNQYMKQNKISQKEIYTHVTTAIDSSNVRAVFDTCKSIVLRKNLSSTGFMVE